MRAGRPQTRPRPRRGPETPPCTSQSAGAMPTNTSDDAFTPPDREEHQREERRVAPSAVAAPARIVSPTSHGSPAHASSSTEIRAVNASWYGVSMYTSAPASAPARRTPSIVNNQRAPSTAASEIVPSQQPLRDPVGHADLVHEPEVRAHREQVADALVRHRAHAHVRIPQVRRAREQPAGIEVEVLLRVRAQQVRRRREERDVREDREPDDDDGVLDATAGRGHLAPAAAAPQLPSSDERC